MLLARSRPSSRGRWTGCRNATAVDPRIAAIFGRSRGEGVLIVRVEHQGEGAVVDRRRGENNFNRHPRESGDPAFLCTIAELACDRRIAA